MKLNGKVRIVFDFNSDDQGQDAFNEAAALCQAEMYVREVVSQKHNPLVFATVKAQDTEGKWHAIDVE